LYLSSDWARSSSGLCAIRWYYETTKIVGQILGVMFKAIYPAIYDKYMAAFQAGVWEKADPGPWLGRAIVYKLQVNLHNDGRDDGPTASFPVGFYNEGHMLVPDLKAKLL
jgi:hypothetical protein